MGALVEDLERARAELVAIERQVTRWSSRTAGKRAEIARLTEVLAARQGSGLPVSRTDAIVSVLSRGADSMSPSKITEALVEAGRDDELHSVTATRRYLLDTGRVIRDGRGRCIAP